jgi:hypothetical protein
MAIKMPRCIAIYAGKTIELQAEALIRQNVLRGGPSEGILRPIINSSRYQQVARGFDRQ